MAGAWGVRPRGRTEALRLQPRCGPRGAAGAAARAGRGRAARRARARGDLVGELSALLAGAVLVQRVPQLGRRRTCGGAQSWLNQAGPRPGQRAAGASGRRWTHPSARPGEGRFRCASLRPSAAQRVPSPRSLQRFARCKGQSNSHRECGTQGSPSRGAGIPLPQGAGSRDPWPDEIKRSVLQLWLHTPYTKIAPGIDR
jgi:hypothetical protein